MIRFISYTRPLHQGLAMWLFYLIYRHQYREPRKLKKKNMFQTKEPDDSDTKFKIMVIKILTEAGRTMHKENENFNENTEKKIRKYKTEITELKNIRIH